MKRSRKQFVGLTITVMIMGLLSRKVAFLLPVFLNNYLGDTLWALMIFLGIASIFPKRSTFQIWVLAIFFCWFIECTQLYQGAWLNKLRATTLGGLILGYVFLWTDLIAYTIGTAVGAGLDRWLWKKRS